MHCYIRAEVLDAHCDLPVPQRLSLLLRMSTWVMNVMMVRSASGKLGIKVGYQGFKTIDGVQREFGEPAQRSPFNETGTLGTRPHRLKYTNSCA